MEEGTLVTRTIRILRLESVFTFSRLGYVNLVLVDTPANARLQRCVRD